MTTPVDNSVDNNQKKHSYETGDVLPELKKPPITRQQLKEYAVAGEDQNPIHLDDEIAKQAGLPGVIAHGMLTMAFMGEFLFQLGGRIQDMSCRFKSMALPGDTITVSGKVTKSTTNSVSCEIIAKNQRGEITASGTGTISY